MVQCCHGAHLNNVCCFAHKFLVTKQYVYSIFMYGFFHSFFFFSQVLIIEFNLYVNVFQRECSSLESLRYRLNSEMRLLNKFSANFTDFLLFYWKYIYLILNGISFCAPTLSLPQRTYLIIHRIYTLGTYFMKCTEENLLLIFILFCSPSRRMCTYWFIINKPKTYAFLRIILQ